MDSIQLYQAARKVQPSAGHDMLALTQELGIHVEFADDYKDLLGMYFNKWHHRFIFLNSRLDEDWLPMVLAHEIGHDQLHRSAAIAAGGFQEFNLFNMADRAMEYEANMFAAQVALPDEEILEYIMRGCDVAQIAQLMHSDINLVALKTAELNRQGRRFRQPEHRCDFLK